MAATRWSEEKSVKFVGIYEKYDCLWNTRCKEYKDKEARVAAIRKLICSMRELGIEMSEDDVKTRIKTIRTTYMSELRKVEKSQNSAASLDDLYIPTCAWFNDADRFLRNVVSHRPAFENLNSTEDTYSQCNKNMTIGDACNSNEVENKVEIVNGGDIVEPLTQSRDRRYVGMIDASSRSHIPSNPTKKRARRSSDDISFTVINTLKKICDTASELMKEDEFDIFGKHVASQLRSMNIVRAIDVQTQINDIISTARIQDIEEKEKERTSNKASQHQVNDSVSS